MKRVYKMGEKNEDRNPGNITMDSLDNMDFNIIADMPWAEHLWVNIQKTTKKGFLNWCNIVKKLVGTNAAHVEDWSKQYSQTIDETYCDLVLDLVHLQSKTIDKIQVLLARLQTLCDELHQTLPQQIGEAGLSLFEEQNKLMKQVQEYESIVNNKKKEINKLIEKQRRLCKYMEEEPKIVMQYPPLPTPAQLEAFQTYIDELESKKFQREEKYCSVKCDIVKLVEDLKYNPSDDFEKKIVMSDDFVFSVDNMKKLDFFVNSLKEIKKTTEEEVFRLREKVEDLWKMLDVDLMDRDEFRSHYTGSSIDTLKALQHEVKRCEEVRKANIKTFVDKLRVKLEEMWQKCHCSELDKRTFKYLNSDCYTEDLLDLYEMEIQKWKKFYEENDRILGLLEKHSELWEKVIKLEENVTGPNRYHNRGGKLLLEEKERNKLSKLIPKIEEEIMELSEDYKRNNQHDFLTFGRSPKEYLEYLHTERENSRKNKLSARKLQKETNTTHTPGRSGVVLFPSTSSAVMSTPRSVMKRKILATPNTDVSKRIKVATPRSMLKSKQMTVAPKIKITSATLTLPNQKRWSRTSLERRKRLENVRKFRRSKVFDKVDADTTKTTTYTDFQSEISHKELAQSTIILPEVSGKSAASSSKYTTPGRPPRTPKSPLSTTSNRTLSKCKNNLKLLF